MSLHFSPLSYTMLSGTYAEERLPSSRGPLTRTRIQVWPHERHALTIVLRAEQQLGFERNLRASLRMGSHRLILAGQAIAEAGVLTCLLFGRIPIRTAYRAS